MEWHQTSILLPHRRAEWQLRPISDVHLGSAACDVAALKEEIAFIRDTPDCYTFLGGDLNEAIWVDDAKRFDLEMHLIDKTLHRDFAKKSCARAAELFYPIRDKILFAITGNHEEEFHKRHHFDMTADIADRLKVPYLMYSALVLIKCQTADDGNGSTDGRRTYYTIRLRVHHGTGGGRKHGGKINRVVDMSLYHDADIYWMGHVHTPIKTIGTVMGITENGKPTKRDRAFIVNAGFRKAFIPGQADYSERFDYPAPYIGTMPLKIWYIVEKNHVRFE